MSSCCYGGGFISSPEAVGHTGVSLQWAEFVGGGHVLTVSELCEPR